MKSLIFATIERCEFLVKPIRRILFKILLIDEVALRGLTPQGTFEIPGGETALRLMDRMTLLETRVLWSSMALPQHSGTLRAQSSALLANPESLRSHLGRLAEIEFGQTDWQVERFLVWLDELLTRGSDQRAIVVASFGLVKELRKSRALESRIPKLQSVGVPLIWIEPVNDLYGPLYFGYVPDCPEGTGSAAPVFSSIRCDVLTALLAEQTLSQGKATHVWLNDILSWNHPLVSTMLAHQAVQLAAPSQTTTYGSVTALGMPPTPSSGHGQGVSRGTRTFRAPKSTPLSDLFDLLQQGGQLRVVVTDSTFRLHPVVLSAHP